MQAIRLHIKQPVANYRQISSVDNKMTYPLPYPSTVIGALHRACGYNEYHPMDVSIQGKFGSQGKKLYVSHCFMNSVMDDRGILIKAANSNFMSGQYIPVAKAKKSQGNSFKKGITIDVFNERLLQEYRELLQKKETLDDEKKKLLEEICEPLEKKAKELLQQAKKAAGEEAKKLKEEAKSLKTEAKKYKEEFKERVDIEYTQPIDSYQNITLIPQYYEVLYDVELVIHVRSDEQTLQDIMDNYENIQCLGRSEDFVTIMSCSLVTLSLGKDGVDIQSPYSMYVHNSDYQNECVIDGDYSAGSMTKYYATKKYHFEPRSGKRIFSKVPVVYVTNPAVDEEQAEDGRVFVDTLAGMSLVVNFL